MLLTHDILLPKWVLKAWCIDRGGNIVSWKWVQGLFEVQKFSILRLGVRLTRAHIDPTRKEQMRAGLAINVFSSDVAAAILTLVANGDLP